MAHARYYRFGGEPLAYMANWSGLPPIAHPRRGNRELGAVPRLKRRVRIPKHEKTLKSVPLRPSGPEPLDPGEMPANRRNNTYQADYMVQSVGPYINGRGHPPMIEADGHVNLGADDVPGAGPFGLSRNESRLAALGLAGLAAFILYKRGKKRA